MKVTGIDREMFEFKNELGELVKVDNYCLYFQEKGNIAGVISGWNNKTGKGSLLKKISVNQYNKICDLPIEKLYNLDVSFSYNEYGKIQQIIVN